MTKLKKIILRAAAAVIMLAMLTLPASVFAAVGDVPSLFHNDEEWYKDGLYPMTVRGGKYYIPAELFSMFEYISVTSPLPNNILICNTQNGRYVSILFTDSSAAVNGDIVRNVGMFRDGDMYYVDASLVCDGIGMDHEIYMTEDGSEHLRLYDSECSVSFEELIHEYIAPDSGDGDTSAGERNEMTKRIYLMCNMTDQYNSEYSAQVSLDYHGLDYTMFLTSSAAPGHILLASAHGEYGVIPTVGTRIDGVDIAAELDRVNGMAYEYTGRRVRLTLSTWKAEEDGILKSRGYIPIEPDLRVNGSSDAEAVFEEILRRATKYGYVTVYLEDCWNSTMIASLLSKMEDPSYTTSNLIDSGK